MKKVLGVVFAALLLTSCGTVGLVSTPSEYVSAGKEVSFVKKGVNVFGLTPLNAQKETLAGLEELKGKCTNGVTNITTTVSATAFIVGFEKIEVTANCK